LAAAVKLRCRAAASKVRIQDSGGSDRVMGASDIDPQTMESTEATENPLFAMRPRFGRR
jgi:hypothetical protein